MSNSTESSFTEPIPTPTDDETSEDLVLIGIEDGYGLLFADHRPNDMDLIPFSSLGKENENFLFDAIRVATGTGIISQLGSQAMPPVQGLVRIAPDSMKLLSQPGNALLQSAGQNLGAIVNANGKIVAQARFLPATGAQTASLTSALGPGLALLAIQMELASISRKVDENIELTRDVLKAIHQDHWSSLIGLHETSLRAIKEARAIGTVTDDVFAPLKSREADLRKYRDIFLKYVDDHIDGLDADVKGRREFVHRNFDQIIADCHGMLMAELAWYRAQVLRAVNVAQSGRDVDSNARLVDVIVEESKREHEKAMDDIQRLLQEVERQMQLLALLPTGRSLPFTAKRRSISESLEMAKTMSRTIAELTNQISTPRSVPSPEIIGFKDLISDNSLEILAWASTKPQNVLALADLNLDKLISNDVYLGITDDSFFVADKGQLLKEGVIDSTIPLIDIRYVRFSERAKKGPLLEIITKNENLSFSFDSWAAEGSGLEKAQRIASLFMSVMNIPESEKVIDPLMEKVIAQIEPQKATALEAVDSETETKVALSQ